MSDKKKLNTLLQYRFVKKTVDKIPADTIPVGTIVRSQPVTEGIEESNKVAQEENKRYEGIYKLIEEIEKLKEDKRINKLEEKKNKLEKEVVMKIGKEAKENRKQLNDYKPASDGNEIFDID